MGLQQKLTMRQSQSLVMTPQLSQSIKLLTMSNMELAAFVERELESNPFLELAEPEAQGRGEDKPKEDDEPRESLSFDGTLEASTQKLSEKLGTKLDNVFEDDTASMSAQNSAKSAARDPDFGGGPLKPSASGSDNDTIIAETVAHMPTLRDHLAAQLSACAGAKDAASIAHHIIDSLDDAGYFREELVLFAERLGCSLPEVKRALSIVQSFEPCGIAARDLRECLSLQLAARDRLDPAMRRLIDNLELLGRRDFTTLRELTGLDGEDLFDALKEIQALEPKPATQFRHEPLQTVTPDILISEKSDGTWRIELNSDTLPRVLIDNEYVAEVGNRIEDGSQSSEFVSGCLQNAHWLTRSMDQRAQTILKVMGEIVKQQDAFFAYGIQHLKPLTLRMVADAIDMHESSVSRVTTNKYVLTPRGTFELKYFFTTALSSTHGAQQHSAEAVRHQIRDLVKGETADLVLSDDAIVDILKSNGVDIARRTVAKYRDAMQIASSVQRRRELRAAQQASSRP